MSVPQPDGSWKEQSDPQASPAKREVATWQQVVANPRPSPPPTARASAALIAHWFRGREIEDAGEFSNAWVIGWCREQGVEPLPVMLALVAERSGADIYSAADMTCPINDGLWEERQDNGDIACCPVPHWSIGATTGKQMYSLSDCADSWRCFKHSGRRANAVLAAARREWLGLDIVYYAVVREDLESINRVRVGRPTPLTN